MRMNIFRAGAVALALIAAPLTGCATSSDPATEVAQLELTYTPLANAAAGYLESGAADKATSHTIRELNDAIDHKGTDGQRHGLLIAARDAAQNGDSVTQAAAIEALRQGIAALGDYETQKGLAHQ